jgi:uncharacterized damage-inducible protein DinB
MTTSTGTTSTVTGERADLLETLGKHRHFLRVTVDGLTDEQARQRTTVSELTLGGLVKHVAATEAEWIRFILEGPVVMGTGSPDEWSEDVVAEYAAQFRLKDDETLAGVLAGYEEVARRTDELVATIPSLDAAQPLPEAPWFEQGARWSARRVFLHVIAETAQHSGHADILREALDGQKTMG